MAWLGVEHVDDEHAEAALTHIAQRLDEARIQQRAEHEYQRPGRQGRSREPRQADGPFPAARGGHHEIQEALIVPLPLAWSEPAQAAGENDQADSIARRQIPSDGAGRAPQDEIERRRPRVAHIGRLVGDDDDVLCALRGEGREVHRAMPRRRGPVDAALPVAGHELAHPGELAALAGRPGRVLAEPAGQPAEHDAAAQTGWQRPALDVRQLEHCPAFDQPVAIGVGDYQHA